MTTNARRALIPILLTALPAALGLLACAPGGGDETPVPDTEIGLSKTSVFDVPEPAAVVANASEPGEGPALEPAFEDSPTPIPHGIVDFLPITRDENMCLDCHMVEEKVEGEPTPVPASHYVDLRNAPEEMREEPAGARYICTACHVAQTDAAALVANNF